MGFFTTGLFAGGSGGLGELNISANATTTDATQTTADTISIAEGQGIQVEVWATATNSDNTKRFAQHLSAFFYRASGGNVTQEGTTMLLGAHDNSVSWSVDLNADTSNQTIDIDVTGETSETITWKISATYSKVSV